MQRGTEMGPVSAARPVVQIVTGLGSPTQTDTANRAAGGGRHHGAKAENETEAAISRPVSSVSGTSSSATHLADRAHMLEAARARAEAAHAAYTRTALVMGANPLRDPIP